MPEAPPEEPAEPEGAGIKSYPDPTVGPEVYTEKMQAGAVPRALDEQDESAEEPEEEHG